MAQPTLAETTLFVIEAMKNCKDKVGNPAVLHSLEVMHSLRFETEEIQLIGLLHDVVEDTKVTIDALAFNGYSRRITDAVETLTRKINEPYFEYLNRIKKNPLATRVKIADAENNLKRCNDRIGEFASLATRYKNVLIELTPEREMSL